MTDLKRLTFAVTPEMESALDELKREYYKMNQSELLRMMFDLGYKRWRETKAPRLLKQPRSGGKENIHG